jgi:gas vesicle protein
MEKEFKEIIKESKKSLEKAEKKIERLSGDFTEEVSEFWGDLKKRFSKVNDKLKDAYHEFDDKSELKAHLSMMEARDKLEQIKESAEKIAFHASNKTKGELDIAALKAHLAKMEAEDRWEETKKELSHQYGESKAEVEKLAKKAGKEINEIFLKLTEIV